MQEPRESEDADDRLGGHLAAAWGAYRAARPAQGIVEARAALALAPRHGEAWYVLAACLERADRLGEADRCFHRAAQAATEPQAPPYRVSWRRFRGLVDDAVAALPDRLRAAFGEVTLVVADYAEPGLLTDHPDEVELLGLFTGAPRGERFAAESAMDPTPCIHLWRRAHEHECSAREELAAEVRRTLFHEFGHYLGYDEDGLEALGLD